MRNADCKIPHAELSIPQSEFRIPHLTCLVLIPSLCYKNSSALENKISKKEKKSDGLDRPFPGHFI